MGQQLCRTTGQHRDNTQLLFGHEEDIATTTKATPLFLLFCCAAASFLSFRSPSCSCSFFVLAVVLETTTAN